MFGEGGINAVKLLRACGGCLGTRRRKGVANCDKPGEAVKRALIPGYPMQTQGTETSHYLEEEKEKSIPSVAASERGTAQTGGACLSGVVGPVFRTEAASRTALEWATIGGESPVCGSC